jgi:ribonuclease III
VATTRVDRLSTPSSRTEDLLADLGVPPKPGSLAELALTHRSFAGGDDDYPAHNERLEFLGDAVLGSVVADILYNDYPELTEGEMTRSRAAVVGMPGLVRIARDLGIGNHLRLSKGEETTGGREKDSLLADTLEALVGALYLEKGFAQTARVVRELFSDAIEMAVGGGSGNFKGLLQEEAVQRFTTRPRYEISSSGPEHDKRFSARVFIGGQLCGEGAGRSKKEAEQLAAGQALNALDEIAEGLTAVRDPDANGEPSARAS